MLQNITRIVTIHAAFGWKARHILAQNRFKAKPHNLASATVVCRKARASRGRWMKWNMEPENKCISGKPHKGTQWLAGPDQNAHSIKTGGITIS